MQPDETRRHLRALNELVIGIRRSLDTRLHRRVPYGDAEFEAFKTFQQKLEGMRLSLRQVSLAQTNALNPEYLKPIMLRFKRELQTFTSDDLFNSVSSISANFGGTQNIMRDSLLSVFANDGNYFRTTILDACQLLETFSSEIITSESRKPAPSIESPDLRKVIPPQRVAPIQFQVSRGRLTILAQASSISDIDAQGATLAKGEIILRGEHLIDELRKSNCDRRLMDVFTQLQSSLTSDRNIISIGLSNIACQMAGQQYCEELSDSVQLLMQAHSKTVEMYASQFPEWNRFVENASRSNLDEEQIQDIKFASEEIVRELEKHRDVVDDEVPKTIGTINSLLDNPRFTSRRVGFALLRSIENMMSTMFTFSADVIQETMAKTKSELSSKASKLLVYAFLSIAGIALHPLYDNVKDLAWVRDAIHIVENQIKSLE